MSIINIYHGSSKVIEHPIYDEGKSYNDYGRGFYCTEDIELAKEWASTLDIGGYANHYTLNTDDLRILNLSAAEYSSLSWLAVLMENRICRLGTAIEKRGRDYLLENFLPDYERYDVIIGYRADDSYFSFARAFIANTISLAQLERALRLGKLGEQIVLKSEKAFESIRFVDYSAVDNAVYYPMRKTGDENVKEAYQKELMLEDTAGIYIRDIIREEMKPGDDRLR